MNKITMSKRIFAGLLSVILFLSLVPVTPVLAEENTQSQCVCTPVDGVHAAECPLYTAPEPTCTCEPVDGIHAAECPLYTAPEPTCTCEPVDGIHVADCPLYTAPESTEPVCTCAPMDGLHAADCPKYEQPPIALMSTDDIMPLAVTPTMTVVLADDHTEIDDFTLGVSTGTPKWDKNNEKDLQISLSGLTSGEPIR